MAIPQIVETEAGKLEAVISQEAAHQDAAASRLSAVAGNYAPGSLTESAATAGGARSAIRALLSTGGQILTVTPWTSGAGETGEGFYSQQLRGYLSPGKALEYLMKKLQDNADSEKDGAAEMILVIVSSNSLSAWIDRLTAINAVFPLGDLPFCERRARQLAALESEKMIKKAAPLNPHWRAFDIQQAETVRNVSEGAEQLGALSAAYAADVNPVQELQSFIQARKSKAQAALQSWSNLKSILNSVECEAMYFTGSPFSIAYQLPAQAGTADNNAEVYAAAVAILGASGSLQFFKEVFEL